MNILLINTKKAKLYPLLIQQYLQTKGITCYLSDFDQDEINKLISTNNLTPANTLIHARTAGPHVTQTYKELEQKGFIIVNKSLTTALTSNKYESQIFAGKGGLPVAQTMIVSKSDVNEILSFVNNFNQLVAKPIYSQGGGIFCKKVDKSMSVHEVRLLVEDIPGDEIIIQEYIAYQKLIRTIVVEHKMIMDATTYDTPTDWKASVCMNPNIKKYESPDQRLIDLAQRTAKAFEAEISFIDFFQKENGEYILNELNTACGLIIHEDKTGIRIHEHISDYLIKRLNLLKL